jgi:hypothetical protein
MDSALQAFVTYLLHSIALRYAAIWVDERQAILYAVTGIMVHRQ